ncbi:MAG: hypothetical protein AB1806_05400 [Acidobacteriota bacterium]
MLRAARVPALVIGVVTCSACFNVGLIVNVRPDGTGTIDETTMMTAQAMQQMAGLAAMAGGSPAKPDEMFSEVEIRRRAEQLGTGVRLESVEPIRTADGEGYRAHCSFEDVTKLSLSQVPSTPIAGMAGGPSGGDALGVRFDRGPSGSLLVLTMPPPTPEASGERRSVIPENVPPEALMMARQMFKGARMSVVLAFEGRIIRTNAPAALVNGSRMTLAEIDFERLLADPAALERIRSLRTIAGARTIAGELPGVKMFTEPELVVHFTGR